MRRRHSRASLCLLLFFRYIFGGHFGKFGFVFSDRLLIDTLGDGSIAGIFATGDDGDEKNKRKVST